MSHAVAERGLWRDTASRFALLPLRVFLGATFIYAGIDKLSDPAFLGTGTGSMLANLNGAKTTAAIPAMVDLALRNPDAFGQAIAFGELAVGVGTIFGLWARLAALGGALISLSLWLTVTWQVQPYYLGNDLAYLMAWLPLLLAGAQVMSVDAMLARRKKWLEQDGADEGEVRRRAVLDGGLAALLVGAVAGAAGGIAAWRGRSGTPTAGSDGQTGGTSQTGGTGGGGGGGVSLAAADVPVGQGAKVKRTDGKAAYVVQPQQGEFTCFSAICTHSGCEVDAPKGGRFSCPCHGSEFDAATGEVLKGPAAKALDRFGVRQVGDQLEIQ